MDDYELTKVLSTIVILMPFICLCLICAYKVIVRLCKIRI